MPERVSSARNDLWVFRDGRRTAPAVSLHRKLDLAVDELLRDPRSQSRVITALLRAGELESALSDAALPKSRTMEQLTDALAQVFCGDSSSILTAKNLACELRFGDSEILGFSPAEGFAYYALHPLDFSRIPGAMLSSSHPAAVIGIRSIGTTLSAIVTAALRQRARAAERITIRPTGHPYERVTRFSDEQKSWIEQHICASAEFLVVDEGPGRSGSSFLSVGEALVEAGVPVSRILFVGSRETDAQQLCTTNALARWNRFRFVAPRSNAYQRFSQDTYVGGGMWKETLPGSSVNDVACWPQMERLKFLSRDERWLFKFEGFGRFGQEILGRASVVAAAGFGTRAEEVGDGMLAYPFIKGKILRSGDVSRDLLDRLAEYCAFRSAEFGVRESPPNQLAEMVRFNVQQEFGIEIDMQQQLQPERHVLVDGRMQPYEWIRPADRELIKVDACSHGDDHFFPGPTDIAWDLAGAIVEWNLDQQASEQFLCRYQQLSGDDARRRIPGFLLAYSVFRQAYCQMAVSTVGKWEEQVLLEQASAYYRGLAESRLRLKAAQNQILAEDRHARQDSMLPFGAPTMQLACLVRDENQ